jgi:hypothetical protein
LTCGFVGLAAHGQGLAEAAAGDVVLADIQGQPAGADLELAGGRQQESAD